MPPTDDELLIDDWLYDRLKDSAEELKARRLIADRLRYGPLKRSLLAALATLIDPDTRDVYGWWLTAKHPRGAKPTIDGFRVATIIEEQLKLGIKKEAAVQDAMTRCNVKSRDKALAYHKKYKPLVDRMKRQVSP